MLGIKDEDEYFVIFREVYWNVPFKKSSELLDELERYMDFDIPEPSAQFKSDKDEINTGDITQ